MAWGEKCVPCFPTSGSWWPSWRDKQNSDKTRLNGCLLTCAAIAPRTAAIRVLEALVRCVTIRQSFLLWLQVWNLQLYQMSLGFSHWLCAFWPQKLGTIGYLWLEHDFPAFCLVNSYATIRHQVRCYSCRRFSLTHNPHASLDAPAMFSQRPLCLPSCSTTAILLLN